MVQDLYHSLQYHLCDNKILRRTLWRRYMEFESQAQLKFRYKVTNNGVFNLDLEVKDVHARIGLYPATSIMYCFSCGFAEWFHADLHNGPLDKSSWQLPKLGLVAPPICLVRRLKKRQKKPDENHCYFCGSLQAIPMCCSTALSLCRHDKQAGQPKN
jgi:hypothetical protein